MEKIGKYSSNQYLRVLRETYLKAINKKEKAQTLMNIATIPVKRGNISSGRYSTV